MMKRIAVFVAGCAMAGAGLAEPPAVTLQLGAQDGYRAAGVGLRLAPAWTDRWGGWHAAAHVEFELNHFRYQDGGHGPRSLQAAGVGGALRLTRGGEGLRPYAEIGLSGNVFSRTHLGPKDFSTAFQFGEHLGIGVDINDHVSAGWRYAHFSNADLAKPNNGLDFQELVIGVRF